MILICIIWSGIYSGGFDIEYPVNVGHWAIVVDAFVCRLKLFFLHFAECLCVLRLLFLLSGLQLSELLTVAYLQFWHSSCLQDGFTVTNVTRKMKGKPAVLVLLLMSRPVYLCQWF